MTTTDKDLMMAREIAANQAETNELFGFAFDIRDGNSDDSCDVQIALAAIKASRKEEREMFLRIAAGYQEEMEKLSGQIRDQTQLSKVAYARSRGAYAVICRISKGGDDE